MSETDTYPSHNYISQAFEPTFFVGICRILCVGSINDKNNIARKRTYAETVATYVTPLVAPQIAIATHV